MKYIIVGCIGTVITWFLIGWTRGVWMGGEMFLTPALLLVTRIYDTEEDKRW